MTAPLTPPGCDLRDFPRIMIDIPRLLASGFNATASRSPLAWMIGHKLWYRSWHQVPAGSLPDDDDELCHLAELGFDRRSFARSKALALRGWVKCEDGRLYHPIVCEAALEGWQEKLRQRLASGSGNEKRWGVPFNAASVAADLAALINCLERLNPQSKALLKARKSLASARSGLPEGHESDPTGTDNGSHRDDKNPGILSLETETGTGISKEEEGKPSLSCASPPSADHEAAPAADGAFDIVLTSPPVVTTPARKKRGPLTLSPVELEEFNQFWAVYPLRKARRDAEEAFVKRRREGVPLDAILTGAVTYAAERAGEEAKFTKYASGWLDAGRWDDEHIARGPQGGQPRRGMEGYSAIDQAVEGLDWPPVEEAGFR